MRSFFGLMMLAVLCSAACGQAGSPQLPADEISPSRPVPVGEAPGMKWQLVKDTPEEKVYAVVFYKGDEALSGLTDFAIAQKIGDAHFTGIGAVSSATLAYLMLPEKVYHRIDVREQVEVASLIGDVATFNGKPVVHMHAVLAHRDGSATAGHVFALHVNPTLEVFVTANSTALGKRPDDASGMKVIDPKR